MFGEHAALNTYLEKIKELAPATEEIDKNIEHMRKYVNTLLAHLENLKRIGISLSAEETMENIYELILEEAVAYTNADGATVYAVENNSLEFKMVYNGTLKVRMGGDLGKISWQSIPLFTADGKKNLTTMATYVAHSGQPSVVEDIYNQNLFDTTGTKRYDATNNYRSQSMVALPIKDHEENMLGVIQLINACDETGRIISFTKEHLQMLSSLTSLTAMSLRNRKLIASLEELLTQFIHLIADAIDRKSRYTGGHIARVAHLSEAFAAKINADNVLFPRTNFNRDELNELSFAAWMHDLGKIITPVHIMDKSTKLETILDRIELIRLRFLCVEQAVQKDRYHAEIHRQPTEIYDRLLADLKGDLHFLENLNQGTEFVKSADLDRLKRILEFSYHSDEKLFFLLTEEEYHNLAIQKGTLLPDEIEKMREHVAITEEMLKKLTFPKKLVHVPEYAAAHHEKLNGQGYPHRLKEHELSLQARIIGIADLFEALTAADRPYKKGKTLSETFKILAYAAKDKDIDVSLLELLIESGLYSEYAEKYLHPDQIDEVDFSTIKKIYKGQ